MGKKYEITEKTMTLENGTVLHRIRALKDFADVEKGDLGGWIESENNLSHEDNCWVYDNATVYDGATVFCNAEIRNNASVFESACATDFANIYGNAKVYGQARIYGNANITDNANVYEYATVTDRAFIQDNAKVHSIAHVANNAIIGGNSEILCNITIYGNIKLDDFAYISSNDDLLYIGPMGSRNNYTTFFKTKNNAIFVCCGCFSNTIDVFEQQVRKFYAHNDKYLNQCLSAINFAKTLIKL